MPLNRRGFVRNLFAASQTSQAGRIFLSNLSADDQPRLTFAVIGDWGRQGSPDQRQVASQMGIACERDKATFVVSVGDNFYEHGVTSVDDSHWQHSFETVYDAPGSFGSHRLRRGFRTSSHEKPYDESVQQGLLGFCDGFGRGKQHARALL